MSRTRHHVRDFVLVAVLSLPALLLAPASPLWARPATKADPMLQRLLRGHGVRIDSAGQPLGISRQELEYYSRFLTIDPKATPPTARIRMRLDNAARYTLESLGIKVHGRTRGFASAVVPIPRLQEIAAIPGVEWMQIGRIPRPELDVSVPIIRADQTATTYGTRGQGVLVGDVDTGVDWHHADFRNSDGTTRIKYLWDQTKVCPAGVGSVPPPPFDFGCQYTEAEINAALGAGPAIDFKDGLAHGTHVLGIAGGNGRATGNGQPSGVYVGPASQANLVMIKIFPEEGLSCDQCFDIGLGLDLIDAKAAEFGMPYVVNLSVGQDLGGHDGSDLDEQTIDALTGPGRPGKAIVKSAGNDRGVGIHVSGTVATGGTINHTFTIPSYVPGPEMFDDVQAWEMWYNAGDTMTVTILDPTTAPCTSTVTLSGTTGGGFHGVSTTSGTMIIDDSSSPAVNGARFFDGEVNDSSGVAPCRGTWTFRVHGDTITQGGRYDIWIYFSAFSSTGFSVNWASPDLTRLISIPGTAFNTTTVGAFVSKRQWTDVDGNLIGYSPAPSLGALASFSSPGPSRDGRIKPEITAPGMGIASALSIDAAADILGGGNRVRVVRDGVHWVIEGTSMAAPHVAGVFAQMLGLNPRLHAVQLRTLVTSTAIRDTFTGMALPNNDWGYGKLDALAAMQMLIKDIPTLTAGTDNMAFSWTGVTTATTYNVYRGDADLLDGSFYGNCFLSGLTAPNFPDSQDPGLNHAFFYLVAGVKDGVEGLLGFKSDGSARLNSMPSCSL